MFLFICLFSRWDEEKWVDITHHILHPFSLQSIKCYICIQYNSVHRVVSVISSRLAFIDHFQAYYFDRSDVALPGLYKYFKKSSDDEREHAMKFLAYQNKRGGDVVFTAIEAPAKNDWLSAKNAMTEALKLEQKVNEVRTS